VNVTTPTEAECQATIVEAARIGGWLVHHARPARTGKGWRTPLQGDPGFPDLVLCGHGRVLVVEIKRKPNKVTPEQTRWLAALTEAGVDARLAWVPEQLDELCAELVAARARHERYTSAPPARRPCT
jgi:VRR-NUC domain